MKNQTTKVMASGKLINLVLTVHISNHSNFHQQNKIMAPIVAVHMVLISIIVFILESSHKCFEK